MRKDTVQRTSFSAILFVAALSCAAVSHGQELGPDISSEAEFFRTIMETTEELTGPPAVDSSISPRLVDPRTLDDAEEQPDSAATRYGIPPARPPLDLPFEIDSDLVLPFGLESLTNSEILGYIAYYCTDGRRQLNRWISRSGRYEDIILAETERQDAPKDLLWVVAVESAFDPVAVSHAGAEGLWQFMPRTAVYLGMRIDGYIDERLDPYVSTVYGIDYLMQLHDLFGSWPLALAAYNAGLGHVRSELRRVNANNFEKLDEYQAIYSNARNYAGRIIAIATIMRNPEHFGFDGIIKEEPMEWEEVQVEGTKTFARIAEHAGIDDDAVAALNPGYLRRATPPDTTSSIRLPPAALSTYVDATSNWDQNDTQTYTLRFGETINDASERFGLAPYLVRTLNGFGSRERVPYGTVIDLPADATAATDIPSSPKPVILPETRFSYPDRYRVFYEIQPGDTLNEIAEHFGVDLYRLAGWNDLAPDAALWSGMTLQIYVSEEMDLSSTVYMGEAEVRPLRLYSEAYWDYRQEQRRREARSARTHTVKSGDTVIGIANQYGVRADDIIRWNDLGDNARIQIGQELRVAP